MHYHRRVELVYYLQPMGKARLPQFRHFVHSGPAVVDDYVIMGSAVDCRGNDVEGGWVGGWGGGGMSSSCR